MIKAIQAITPLLAACLIACGSGYSPLVEQHEITVGQFEKLSIGMEIDQALVAAESMGATVASPVPCVDFRVSKKNLGDLEGLLRASEGVRLTDFRGVYVDLFFNDGRVTRITGSPETRLASIIKVGEELPAVRVKLQNILETRGTLFVHAIVDRDRQNTVLLDQVANSRGSTVYLHECWAFEISSVRPAGVTYSLTFNEGRLTKINYRRARVATE